MWSLRTILLALLCLTLIMGAGCGSTGSSSSSTTEPELAGKYQIAEQENAYSTARDFCAGLGPQETARTFGGGPSELDIALAYTTSTFRAISGGAATDGCLDGFAAWKGDQ